MRMDFPNLARQTRTQKIKEKRKKGNATAWWKYLDYEWPKVRISRTQCLSHENKTSLQTLPTLLHNCHKWVPAYQRSALCLVTAHIYLYIPPHCKLLFWKPPQHFFLTLSELTFNSLQGMALSLSKEPLPFSVPSARGPAREPEHFNHDTLYVTSITQQWGSWTRKPLKGTSKGPQRESTDCHSLPSHLHRDFPSSLHSLSPLFCWTLRALLSLQTLCKAHSMDLSDETADGSDVSEEDYHFITGSLQNKHSIPNWIFCARALLLLNDNTEELHAVFRWTLCSVEVFFHPWKAWCARLNMVSSYRITSNHKDTNQPRSEHYVKFSQSKKKNTKKTFLPRVCLCVCLQLRHSEI